MMNDTAYKIHSVEFILSISNPAITCPTDPGYILAKVLLITPWPKIAKKYGKINVMMNAVFTSRTDPSITQTPSNKKKNERNIRKTATIPAGVPWIDPTVINNVTDTYFCYRNKC